MNESTIKPEPPTPPRPRPPIIVDPPPIDIIEVPLPEPCPPGVEVCIFDKPAAEIEPRPIPQPRILADWELQLKAWDAEPNGVVAAAKPERLPRRADQKDKDETITDPATPNKDEENNKGPGKKGENECDGDKCEQKSKG